jgi:NADH dehydrogenase [ubiquinone] 1 alpha subcomplex assembly factor 6
MIIPAEITAKHGVNQEEVFRIAGRAGKRNESVKGLEEAVFEFATLANDHVITARDMFKDTGGKVPVEAMPVFLSGVCATFLSFVNTHLIDVTLVFRYLWYIS